VIIGTLIINKNQANLSLVSNIDSSQYIIDDLTNTINFQIYRHTLIFGGDVV